ncbi:MAG: heat shock protein [Geobacteraceae bacterium]|nr:MAG: heat shock protein [Geobacteraceae bacterium]
MTNRLKTTLLLSLLTILMVTMVSAIGGMVGSLAMAIIAPVAAMLIQMAVTLTRISGRCLRRRALRPSACSGWRPAQAAHRFSGIPMLDARPATAHMFIAKPGGVVRR